MLRWFVFIGIAFSALGRSPSLADQPESLPGTKLLTMQGDISSQLVAGVDRFLLREIDQASQQRPRYWRRDFSSAEKYNASIAANRQRLAHMLGIRDPRVPFEELELVATTGHPALVAQGERFEVFAVRWPAFGDVHGEGLLLVPKGVPPVANLIALSDADQTPEQFVGIDVAAGKVVGETPLCRLAASGWRVLVPSLVDRQMNQRGPIGVVLSNREYLYRPAYEMGRHLIGYELQKVLAAVDWLSREAGGRDPVIGLFGYGEGGMLALYAAALDARVDAACVSGYFDNRNRIWQQPIDRNVFGLLDEFGDAELASMVAPRALIVEACRGPEVTLPGKGGAPARLVTPPVEEVRREVARARTLSAGLKPPPVLELVESGQGSGPYGSPQAFAALQKVLAPEATSPAAAGGCEILHRLDASARQQRQIREMDQHTQGVLRESPFVRQEFMKKLDFGAPENAEHDRIARYAKSTEWYRNYFYDEVIGRFSNPVLPPNVRTRKAHVTKAWTGYEVVMDVYPDVIAYGILLLPNDLKPGEKRPVVVCQHGLEGRPQDTIGKPGFQTYKAFAAQLAERGFITFAPQNLYIFGDRFRALQRKANPLKKTLFSIIVPQHQQIVDWLQTLPMVDGKRIALYGLSYGGKTAMRVPPLVTDYCLAICSGDFNEWVEKNASNRNPLGYVFKIEYEIFEFNLGNTFNYAEMAALIAPRPFMVERGHFDHVSTDETVGYEFAKVRRLYAAKLKLPDRCAIEWFNGPHTIHGQGTFEFLQKNLNPLSTP